MATRLFTGSLLTTNPTLSSFLSRSPFSLSSLSTSSLRLRSLVAVADRLHSLSPESTTIRSLSTRQTSSSLNDQNPNWSNRPPKETILLDGCDFEHWLVVMEPPEGEASREEIIDSYIKTLAMVIGSEEEARMKIYSVSTRHYYAFGALVSEELSYKLKELPRVRWVLPDSYLDVKNKDYGGEPFINGQAVPYDPKYHEEWVRNNARANERNRRNRNDRPRNCDRSRNFERRRENKPNRDFQMTNQDGQNPGSHMGRMPSNDMGGQSGMEGMQQNTGGMPQNMAQVPSTNMGATPPNYMGQPPPNYMGGLPPNMGNVPNMGGTTPSNMGRVTNNQNFQSGRGSYNGGMPFHQSGGYQQSKAPNTSGGNPYQSQNMPRRDMPPPPQCQ